MFKLKYLQSTLLIISTIVFTSCLNKISNTPKTVYKEWFKAWKNHDGKTIKKYTSSMYSYSTTKEYWHELSKDSLRQVIKPSSKAKTKYIYQYKDKWINFTISNNKFRNLPYFIYNQQTPKNTIKSLILAFKMKKWEIIHDLLIEEIRFKLSDKDIKKMFSTPKAKVFIQKIEENLDSPIIVKNNIGKFIYEKTKAIFLKQVSSTWYIVTLE